MIDFTRQDGSTIQGQTNGVHIVKPLQFDNHTPQTAGMRRLAAVSHDLVGSQALWAGVMLAEPDSTSSVHHHGALETVVYVLSGQSKVRWGSRLEHEADLEPGDFLFIPPYMPHQEINPSPDQATQWVVVRNGQEAIVVNLTKGLNGEYVPDGLAGSDPSMKKHIQRGSSVMSKLTDFRVAVIATDGFEETELTEPVKALREAGARVTILSLKPGEIQGVRHDIDKTVKVKVDRTIGDASAEEFDAVHLPGGTVNADSLRMVPEVQAFLRAMQDAGKPITAICHAPWELVSAGLVRGRMLTSYHSIQDDVHNAGGLWVDREVVKDGNWVTSRQPDDLPAFNRAMIALFSGAAVAANR